MLGSAERGKVRPVSRELLFSKNSNLYDHDISTSQTDERADRQLAVAKIKRARFLCTTVFSACRGGCVVDSKNKKAVLSQR